MDEEYEFVRMSEANFDDFALLANDSTGIELTKEQVRGLFDTDYWGKKFLAFLAYHKPTGEVAAFYGIFPCFAEYDGQRILASQSGSTMTHSKHRKKGLFFETATRTYDLARNEGVKFVYGFPNQFSYRGLMKLGWSHDGNLNSYHMIVPTFPLGYLANKVAFLRPLYAGWFRFVTSHWRIKSSAFEGSNAGSHGGWILLDEGLLEYRPETENRFMIEVGQCKLWINQLNGSMGIGDVDVGCVGSSFKKVIRALKSIAFLTGTFHIRTYVSPDSKLDSLFRNAGYSPREANAICHLDLGSELPLKDFNYVYADLDTF